MTLCVLHVPVARKYISVCLKLEDLVDSTVFQFKYMSNQVILSCLWIVYIYYAVLGPKATTLSVECLGPLFLHRTSGILPLLDFSEACSR
jgi:hypothetical protein